MKIETLSACDQFVAAGLNGIYQGIILTLLVGLSLGLFRRTNAATRHAVWFSTLLLLVGIIGAHGLLAYLSAAPARDDQGRTVAADFSAKKPELTKQAVATPATGLPPRGRQAIQTPSFELFSLTDRPGMESDPVIVPEFLTGVGPASEQTVPSEETKESMREGNAGSSSPSIPEPPSDGEEVAVSVESELLPSPTRLVKLSDLPASIYDDTFGGRSRWLVDRLFNPVSWTFSPGSKVPRITSLVLLALWLTAAGAKVSILAWRLYQLGQLRRGAFPAGDNLSELFRNLRRKLGVKRGVELMVSPLQRSPVLLGFVHPVILLPAEEVHPNEPLEADQILRHELAHVRRYDDWANLVQHFIQAVFFFHPAAWWISRQLSLEREIACDDHVLEEGNNPRTYALLLANLAGRMQRPALLAPGASTNKSQLQKRISMILNTQRNTSPRLAKTRLGFIISATAVIAVVAIYTAPRLVLAQAPPTAPIAAVPAANAAIAVSADGASAPVIAAPPAPPAGLASADTLGDLPPTAIGPEPKFKLAPPGVVSVHPRVIVAPAVPPAAAAVMIAPVPPPRIQAVGGEPRQPRARRSDASLEERLDRLERMVESLMSQRGKPGNFEFRMKGPGEMDGMIDRKQIEEIKELAKRQAQMAGEQAKRATKEAEKALKFEEKRRHEKLNKDGNKQLDHQLDALRKQHEALEREIEKLDRQIEKLEQDQERNQEQDDAEVDQEQNQEQQAQVEQGCNQKQHEAQVEQEDEQEHSEEIEVQPEVEKGNPTPEPAQ